MPVWEFTLIIEGPDIQGDDIINALFEAGCDDSLVGSTNGVQLDPRQQARVRSLFAA